MNQTARRERWSLLLFALGTGLVFAIPLFLDDPYYLSVLTLVLTYAALGTAWNILGGYAGQLSLGHSAFFGIGAYGLAVSAARWNWSPWLGVAFGVGLSVPLALAIGAITFRLRGAYFVLATIALAEVVRLTALAWRDVTNGAAGITAPSLFGSSSQAANYWLITAIAAVAVAFTWWLSHSKLGYCLTGVREDQETAETIGINTTGYKTVALLISAVLTSLTGAFYANHLSYIEPDMVLHEPLSIQIAVVAIIGGRGTVFGPVVGATLLILASEVFRAQFKTAHLLIYAILLMLTILFMPGGILGEIQHRLKSRAAARSVRSAGTFGSSREAA